MDFWLHIEVLAFSVPNPASIAALTSAHSKSPSRTPSTSGKALFPAAPSLRAATMVQITPSTADCSSSWTFPPEQDGWYHAHNALRADLSALQGMLAGFSTQLSGGTAITRPQAAAAGKFVACFLHFLHHHHTNEDAIAMPYLATRIPLPEKIGADHKELERLLDAFDGAMKGLLASNSLEEQRQLLGAVEEVFGRLHPLCLEHLREEEEGPLPAMRRHFTPQEINKHVVAKIMSEDHGWQLMSLQQRRAFFKQEGVPFFVRWILARQANKYNRMVWQPFERECLTLANRSASTA